MLRPDSENIVRRCLYLIRVQQLRELCDRAAIEGKLVNGRLSNDTLRALEYLQNEVTPLVNHTREEEVRELHELCAHLCVSDGEMHPPPSRIDKGNLSPSNLDLILTLCATEERTYFAMRTRLFESLMVYFPRDMKEPEGTLVDVVNLE